MIKQIEIKPDFPSVRRATRKAKNFALKAGFSCMEAFQIELSLSEALNNIVEHGFAGREVVAITLSLHADAQKLSIKIVDHGAINKVFGSFDKNFVNEAGQLKERGFGQIIIDSLMDDVCYNCDSNLNALTLTKRRNFDPSTGKEINPLPHMHLT